MQNNSFSEYDDEQSMSMEVSASEVLEFLRLADAIDILLYYWWVILIGSVLGGAYFFSTSLDPDEFGPNKAPTALHPIITAGQHRKILSLSEKHKMRLRQSSLRRPFKIFVILH